MSNLSDTETIKFLECCSSNDTDSCLSCPLHISDTLCENMPFKEILDLINRLKAENERLTKEATQFADIGKMYSEIKSEARKEFAERLKRRMGFCDLPNVIVRDHIDNLLKEMG